MTIKNILNAVLVVGVLALFGQALMGQEHEAVTFSAPVLSYQRSLLPETTLKYDLGTTTRVWNTAFIKDLTVSGVCTGCGAGGSASWPFTPTSVYGQSAQSTSTLLALTGSPFSVVASSTVNFVNASTTNFTLFSGGTAWFLGLTNGMLAVDVNGKVYKAATTTAANPTASVGLSAVNGSASTFMRSDAAPALDQTIAPTMTGAWAFNNAASTTFAKGLYANTIAAQYLMATSSSATSLFSGNVSVVGTTNFTGKLTLTNATGTTATFTTLWSTHFATPYASSTDASAQRLIDWSAGNTQRLILSANTNFTINSTSSNPLDGGKYVLKVCQDSTASRTLTFTPIALRWGNGTTTISTTGCSMIGMIYDGAYGIYNVIASSTGMKIN